MSETVPWYSRGHSTPNEKVMVSNTFYWNTKTNRPPTEGNLSTSPNKLAWSQEVSVPECNFIELVSALGAGMKMFTRLHLKQEPHHDSARPDDWEGRNRRRMLLLLRQNRLVWLPFSVNSNASFVGPLDSTLHCHITYTNTGSPCAKFQRNAIESQLTVNLCHSANTV